MCKPEDAVLVVNGQRVETISQLNVRRDRGVSIQAYKKDYAPYNRTIDNHLNVTGALDILGTALIIVPGIGLLTPGAWSLDETDINITLFKP